MTKQLNKFQIQKKCTCALRSETQCPISSHFPVIFITIFAVPSTDHGFNRKPIENRHVVSGSACCVINF